LSSGDDREVEEGARATSSAALSRRGIMRFVSQGDWTPPPASG
jgi:hypothetical protein